MRDDARAGTSRLQRRLRDGLVAGEIALALVLLVGAGLLIASFVVAPITGPWLQAGTAS